MEILFGVKNKQQQQQKKKKPKQNKKKKKKKRKTDQQQCIFLLLFYYRFVWHPKSHIVIDKQKLRIWNVILQTIETMIRQITTSL